MSTKGKKTTAEVKSKAGLPRKKKPPVSKATISDERYRAFIENIDDGVYEVDLQGNFTYFNNALCHAFGFPREEIEGANFSKFMDDEHARAAFEIFNNLYKTGKGIVDLMWEIIDREGKRRNIELSANLILTAAGEKKGFRGIARDVTQRIKAQAALKESEISLQCAYEASRVAEKQYRTLLDFLPYPVAVFTLDGKVSYLNPAFTETFGWPLEELKGKNIPYVPPGLEEEVKRDIRELFEKRIIHRHQSRRMTKDGRVLDVVMSGALFSESEGQTAGEVVLLRDVTQEKRLEAIKETLFRISTALPSYPRLADLLDYVSIEIKKLLNVEGALVILLDEDKQELFFLGAAYDDRDTQRRAKEVRYPADKGVSGRVIKTGEPVIVPDTSKDPYFYGVIDHKMHFESRNMLDVPLRSGERIIGVLCATNKREGMFDEGDVELLNMIAGTVALSIENARYAKEITEAYTEVAGLNRAKDRMINRLSHELKTPVSVLLASLNILSKRLREVPEESWKPTFERAQRNLDRILGIQYEVEDIMEARHYKTYELLNILLDQCADEMESMVAEETGEGPLVEKIRKKIDDLYGPKELRISEFSLDRFIEWRLKELKPAFAHREVEIITHLEPVPHICVPEDVLGKVVDGLIRNAVEATPDEGRIEVTVQKKGDGAELIVHDRGIGITDENQRRIFEGFFMTQDTMAYSSKRPFDFNAGGKGADLLRMKIFSERFNFKIEVSSSRCRYIPLDTDECPGRISQCKFCKERTDCFQSGSTVFNVYFPPAPEGSCPMPKKEE
jgi:PAS domain S-box-containing protein